MNGLIGSSLTERQKGGNFGGFDIILNLQHKVNNTAFVAGDVDLSKITMNLKLAGKASALTLRDALQHFGFETEMFTYIRNWAASRIILIAAGSSVKEKVQVVMRFPFQHVVNIPSEKEAVLTINPGQAFNSTNVDATSSIDAFFYEGFGISPGIPVITVHPAAAGAKKLDIPFERNTTRVNVFNYSLSDHLEATKPVASVSLNSDKGSTDFIPAQLYAKRNRLFHNVTDALARFQNFLIHPENGEQFDSGGATVNFDSANVAADVNGAITEHLEIDEHTFRQYSDRNERHAEKNFEKLPLAIRQAHHEKSAMAHDAIHGKGSFERKHGKFRK